MAVSASCMDTTAEEKTLEIPNYVHTTTYDFWTQYGQAWAMGDPAVMMESRFERGKQNR